MRRVGTLPAPSLTTIAQPKRDIGCHAAELLLERVTSGRDETRRVILDPELRIRGTTAPYCTSKENS